MLPGVAQPERFVTVTSFRLTFVRSTVIDFVIEFLIMVSFDGGRNVPRLQKFITTVGNVCQKQLSISLAITVYLISLASSTWHAENIF